MARQERGFTLIELLVVITIIVVLLSLLAPAMDKAIYEAEQAVDGTQLRTIGTNVVQYAMDHKRSYPYRSSLDFGDMAFGNQPVTLRFWRGANQFDDTAQLEGYFGLGINSPLNCPFTEPISIADSHEDSWVFSTYALYFGWALTPPGGSAKSGGMKKYGSSMNYGDDRYRVLAADDDLYTTDTAFATHPDQDGALTQLVAQDEGTGMGTGLKNTVSRWQGPTPRGLQDNNFVYDDGSVQRFNEVVWNESQGTPVSRNDPDDNRFGAIPYTWMANNVSFYRQLPRTR